MTDPTIPTPGTDELTVDPPAGKVLRHYVNESFLSAASLSDTELTEIENTAGSTTPTFGDPTTSKGELQMSVNNDFGGVRGPAIDPSQFEEIRWGVGLRDDLSGGNRLFIGLWDTTGAQAPNASSTYLRQSADAPVADVLFGDGTGTPSPTNFDAIESAPRYIEVRLRPADNDLTIVSGGGDSVEDQMTNSNFDLSGVHYPRVQIGTTTTGTEESFWLSRCWLSVVHN